MIDHHGWENTLETAVKVEQLRCALEPGERAVGVLEKLLLQHSSLYYFVAQVTEKHRELHLPCMKNIDRAVALGASG
jgi:hypothetical protein